MQDYAAFLEQKRIVVPNAGITVDPSTFPDGMFGWQRDLVRWALQKGRAALFADTGLGKSLMQLVWAQHAAERTLILAPLAVAQQTVREGAKWGITVTYARSMADAPATGITVTNYEMAPHFDADAFGAVVLDESSILKSHDGKTRTRLIEQFRNTPMRLCCTATPAPNDIAELANHAEFLGILSRAEMLAAFFVHDDEGWRLKGHAKDPFYRWLSSWGISVKRPSDIGGDDAGYDLPPLAIHPVILPTEYVPDGQLFATTLKGITDRVAVRRQTLWERATAAADLVNAEPDEQWLCWVGLNDESDAVASLIHGAVTVEGADDPEEKAAALMGFADGDIRVLVSKPSIAGFGMNFQRCSRMVFVGLGDSYEQYYQAIRRSWRFGQTRPVAVYVVLTEPEEAIYQNVLRKETEAQRMGEGMARHSAAFARAEIESLGQRDSYRPTVPMRLPDWLEAA